MNQEPTQSQIDLLTRLIEVIHSELATIHAKRILPFDDMVFKAFVGDCGYAFVAMKVESSRETELPWIGCDTRNRDCWLSTKEIETRSATYSDLTMLDVSEQAKNIYSTFLI